MRKFYQIIICLVLFFIVKTNFAYSKGLSLSIDPPLIQIQAIAPSSPITPIVVKNNNENEIELKINIIPIKPKGSDGDVELEPELFTKGFYKFYEQKIQILIDGYKSDIIHLKPLESKEISLNINIQKDDPPGDYYYAVVFMAKEPSSNESSNSSIQSGIATNLLLSVGPKSEDTGIIGEFSTSFFKMAGPVHFKLKIHNTSKHLIMPKGNITIYNMFGKNLGKINILPQIVLVDSDRYLIAASSDIANIKTENITSFDTNEVIWPETNLFGLYKATASIELSENSKVLTQTIYFVAFPVYLFISITVLLFIVISIYIKVKRKV